ncbi:MAG TPA: hypothetical protein VFQ14_06955 [Thermoleophilaceae bacterium]|nr:hypothetical protein [Thermoleophilaceae bacterium]
MRVRLTTITALLVSAVVPATTSAAEPIMKLSDVRAGMQCRSLSTIRGTTPSEFQIDVIDVLRGDPEAIGARILFRASGAAVDATGIGPGFSGSPIYCPDGAGVGRVAGAISEGIGQYGNHVALATPIEEVLGVRPAAAPQARKATRLLRSARPLATPLTVSGLSSPLRRTVLSAARRAGFPLFAAPSASTAFFPPYELAPGTSVAAGISTGDIALGAIGAVTYRDGDKLWAFGHLLDGAGRRSLPLLDAYVYSVIDNPVSFDEFTTTYKLATPGRAVGTLTTDGLSAIAGRVGAPPATIPLTVHARNEANGRTRTLRANVADERSLDLGTGLDMIGSLAAGDAMATVLGAAPMSFTTRMCVRVSVRQRQRPLRFCQRYFDAYGPLGDLSSAFALVDGYKFGPLGIRGISVRMQIRPTVHEAFIVGAQAPLRVKRGQRVQVRLRLQRSRAGRTRVSFPYRVPRDAKNGLQILTIRGPGSDGGLGGLEDFFMSLFGGGGGGGEGPTRSVGDLAKRIATLGAPDGVRATFARKGKGPVVYSSKRLLIRGKTQIPMIVKPAKKR